MAKLTQTEGVVLSATMGAGQSQYRGSSGGYYSRTSYTPVIVYEYRVKGRRFTNDKFAQRPTLINRQSIIARILAKHPVGARVPVYYNPTNPQEAYLQKGYGSTVNAILIGVAILVVAIIAVALYFVFATL